MAGRATLAALAAVLLIAGGLAARGAAATSAAAPINPRTGLPVGVMPTAAQAQRSGLRRLASPAAAVADLTYQGGPVVTNAHVYSVLWGNGSYLDQVTGAASPTMDAFFTHVTDSSYFAWLNEYTTPTQRIDYGSFLGRRTISPASSSNTVQDTTIQSELAAQIAAGRLPPPTVDGSGQTNLIYAVFFPSGDTICMGANGCSGQVFCAYHNSATVDGHHLLYMVLPDAGTMGSGCGAGTDLQNTESFASHELDEVVTDPDVGENDLGWYDNTNGEIGDICVGTGDEATLDTAYTVQKEWSNASNACIANKPASTPSAPTNAHVVLDAGGKVTVSWSAPTSDGGSALDEYDLYQSTSAGVQGDTAARGTSTSWTSGALTNAKKYYFEVAARNSSQVAGPDTGQLAATPDAVAPTATIAAPTNLFQLSNTLTVKYTATDAGSGVASYDVQRRTAPWNGAFSGYTDVASKTTDVAKSLSGSPGHEYCFRVRARDHAGNISAWSADRCTVIPLDDRALSAATTGWTRLASSTAYQGTLTTTTKKGAALDVVGAVADRIALVAETCSTCGNAGIYLNGTLWKTVSTTSSTTHDRVIKLPGTFSRRTATISIRDTSSGKKLVVDGIGIART